MSNIVKTRLPADMLQFVQTKENKSEYIRDLIRADMNNESVAQNTSQSNTLLLKLFYFFEKQTTSKLEFMGSDIAMIEEIEQYVN